MRLVYTQTEPKRFPSGYVTGDYDSHQHYSACNLLESMDLTGFLFGNVNEEGELEDESVLDRV